jgi:Uma2 family endonuclease
MVSVTLTLDPVIQLGREQFHRLCQLNRDVPLERSARGELIVVAPVGGVSGGREADLIADLNLWNRRTGCGLRLGRLVDPRNRQVYVYRQGQAVAAVPLPAVLSGEDVLPGFSLSIG